MTLKVHYHKITLSKYRLKNKTAKVRFSSISLLAGLTSKQANFLCIENCENECRNQTVTGSSNQLGEI